MWCEHDPECSESPYQEPEGTVKPGVIGGFVALGAVLLLIVGYLFYRHQIKKVKQTARSKFARRIRESMVAAPEDAREKKTAYITIFDRVDQDSDGLIQKDDLWNYIKAKENNEMTENEFNAMFSKADAEGSGQLDFGQFITLMEKLSLDAE